MTTRPDPAPTLDRAMPQTNPPLRRYVIEALRGLAHPSPPPAAPPAGAPKRWRHKVAYVLVFAITAILVPTTTFHLIEQYGANRGLAQLLAVGTAGPLVMIVRRPLQAWWIIFPFDLVCALNLAGTADHTLWPWPPPIIIGYLFLMLALALREPRRTLVTVWLLTGVVGFVLSQTAAPAPDGRGDNGGDVLLFVLSGVALFIGATIRERRDAQRRLAEQETISEAERARRTLLEERTRIARELHDVVAHHMSVITVQADSAPYRIDGLPDTAREEFAAIASSARESLTEMRRLLAVLRSEGAEGERAPQPGLDRIQQLVEATVRAGVPVVLSLQTGLTRLAELDAVPQSVDLSAYRIVQEALANVVRHAPGASTCVSVTADDTHLTVLVVNSAATEPLSALESTGTGHGLVGMRERVRLTGGSLDTGPLPDGGFRVAARMPLAAGAPAVAAAAPAASAPPAVSAPPSTKDPQ
ncbi:sensor histidine kinase [Streptomyces sp. NPDC127084]|uniref:sensor histidine kinase n=1 Tax=Streptomyces sp. NPDC127084 TaxID=3347133 RepID=UPI0036683B5B